MEFLLVILLEYKTLKGIEYKTEAITTFETKKQCEEFGLKMKPMYINGGTNVRKFTFSCYEK